MTQKINELYPYKVKIWVGEPHRQNIKQYATVKEIVEDICGISYVAGLNGYGVGVQVFELGDPNANHH